MSEEQKVQRIRIDLVRGVRTVTLDRAEKRNAIDSIMMAELLAAFQSVPAAEERVTVIRSEGTVFCAGIDLQERRETLGEPTAIEDLFRAVEIYPLPVVAVVQGVSAATIWEIAIKENLGKIDLKGTKLEEEIEKENFIELPISARHARHAGSLPRHHDDPFDRMLIAQAEIEDLVVVTHDKAFRLYGVSILST